MSGNDFERMIESAAIENGYTVKMQCGVKDVYLNNRTGDQISVLLPEFLDVKMAALTALEFYK
ncbi:MAG: hypothetical protein CBB87_05945 [Micavibrio sp. TMED27]|nr:hypothetical protein [Micavibrio sp.]OUT91557.1 MAG: hypothetical protein CBB87_05945 [Micavibrio sp. TMED27]|tara:strand:- start:214 stop:402 length:189 start_codon:yes stop_codon:yes gene_type:complete